MINLMKTLTKLLVSGIIFLVLSIVFMFCTASYLPRLSGANYYDHGCFDGVTNLMMEFRYSKNWNEEKFNQFEKEARKKCNNTVNKLKTDGYIFK